MPWSKDSARNHRSTECGLQKTEIVERRTIQPTVFFTARQLDVRHSRTMDNEDAKEWEAKRWGRSTLRSFGPMKKYRYIFWVSGTQ